MICLVIFLHADSSGAIQTPPGITPPLLASFSLPEILLLSFHIVGYWPTHIAELSQTATRQITRTFATQCRSPLKKRSLLLTATRVIRSVLLVSTASASTSIQP